MKTSFRYMIGAAVTFVASLASCSDFEPTGYEPLPDLPVVSGMDAEVVGRDVHVSWTLPAADGITDVIFIRDAQTSSPVSLGPSATSYVIKGQPMGVEGIYTVKVCYDDRYVSQGVSATAVIPVE